jgi:hypothetical protein
MYDQTQPDFFATLKSKTLKTFLQKADQELTEHNLKLEHVPIDQTLFDLWYAHYVMVMTEKGYDVIATPDWFGKKQAEKKQVGGFFLSQAGEWKSTLIYTQVENQKTFAAYKTSLTLPGLSKKRQSLGALIDYFYIQTMVTNQIPWISLGSMRNAFGVINTLGNLDYKLRYGFIPMVDADTELIDSVPLTETGEVTFFGVKAGTLNLFILQPQSFPQESELTRFASDIISVQYLTY